ncbi:hypothetical protein [Heyndrickxia sporothermodurans]|uniref:hypothetical protein n=1 Tax=Heyndrickxia sporothermodurans TaxID=46224 RepID=UPI000D37B609|nr:hypothetical protein [Heyndrickxia sporothermodurans]PTY92989.1 hypothetical protein B5V90_02600 [Heyndrickxia sporothermodurans]
MASLENKPAMALKEKLALLDKVAENVNKKAGKKIIGRIGADAEIMDRLRITFIPTPSMNVNDATGGGFPRRRMTIVAGLPDSGKTSLILETIAMNMKADPSFVAGWLESENSLQKEYICDTFGIDPDRFFYVEHERTGAGEKALDLVESVLATGAIDLFAINSLKCLVPSEEFKKSLGDAVVGVQARMNARMTRKFTSLVAEHNTAFVVVTHLSTDIGSMSRDPLVISGGHAIIYAASITMDLRKRAIQDSDPISKEEGIKVGVTIKKNHCVPDRNPYVKTDYFAIFGEGIEQYLTMLDMAIAQGILVQKGAFIRVPDENGEPKVINGEKMQWQGKDKFRQYCIENQDFFENLKAQIRGEVVQLSEEEQQELIQEERQIAQTTEKAEKSSGSKKKLPTGKGKAASKETQE